MRLGLSFNLIAVVLLLASTAHGKQLIPDLTVHKIAAFFPPPPATGSSEDIADFWKGKLIQESATIDEKVSAMDDAPCTISGMFGTKRGLLTEKQAGALEPIYDVVYYNTNLITNKIKGLYQRVRPSERTDLSPLAKVSTVVVTPNNTSYPSGHSAIAMSEAKMLTQFFPSWSKRLLARAKDVARGRVIGGAHHPSDVAAGLKVGEIAYKEIIKNPEFDIYVKRAKIALAAKGLLAGFPAWWELDEIPRATDFQLKLPEDFVNRVSLNLDKGGKTYSGKIYFQNGTPLIAAPDPYQLFCAVSFYGYDSSALPTVINLQARSSGSGSYDSAGKLYKSYLYSFSYNNAWSFLGTSVIECYVPGGSLVKPPKPKLGFHSSIWTPWDQEPEDELPYYAPYGLTVEHLRNALGL